MLVKARSIGGGQVEAKGQGCKGATDSEASQPVRKGGSRLQEVDVGHRAHSSHNPADGGLEGVQLGAQGWPDHGGIARFGEGRRVAGQEVKAEKLQPGRRRVRLGRGAEGKVRKELECGHCSRASPAKGREPG